MAYEIFDVKKEHKSKADEVLKDDLISRQSIVIRDAKVMDVKLHETLILIEGSDNAIAKAKELFSEIGKRLEGKDRAEVYKKFKDEEGEVLSGVGLIFE
jgi:hypothetical protein